MKIRKGIFCLLWGFTSAESHSSNPWLIDSSNDILSQKQGIDIGGQMTRIDSSESIARKLVAESSEVHSGTYFDDAFYENECYKIEKYNHYICVKWVNSTLNMVAQNEDEITREGANVVTWAKSQVVKLLDWEPATMTWDGSSTTHRTLLLDSSNIRVLDEPGYYYIQRVVATKNSGFVFNTLFANFALSEGGLNNPSFDMCSRGNSPHVQALNNIPMCCKGSHDAPEWSCSNNIEIQNYYAHSCMFFINDCTDPLQDCIPREQMCMQMIPAKEKDQCETMSDSLCIEAGVSKWMWVGEDFSGSNSPKNYFPAGSRSEMTFEHNFESEVESGKYRCSWSFSRNGGEYNAPNTEVMHLSITEDGVFNQNGFFTKDVKWSETDAVIESVFNIPPTSDLTKLHYGVIVNGQQGFDFNFVRLEKLPNDPPTPSPTTSGWDRITGGTAFDSLSVSNNGDVYAAGTNNKIYRRDANTKDWVMDQWSESTYVEISADGNTLLGRHTSGHLYYRTVGTSWTKLSNSGNLFETFTMNEDASEMYSVDANKGNVYFRTGLRSSWQSIQGKFQKVALSGDGKHLWGLQTNRNKNNVLFRDDGTWKRVSGPCQFLSIAVTRTGKHVWATCPTTGELFYRNGFSSEWEQVWFSESASSVSVSANGHHVWLVDSKKEMYYRREYDHVESTPTYDDQTPGGHPQTCQDVYKQQFLQRDGQYKLKNQFYVHCEGMEDGGNPLEWLALTGENYGQYKAGGISPGSTVTTRYNMLRINPASLKVDIQDTTHATSTGSLNHGSGGGDQVTSMPYGETMSCVGVNTMTAMAQFDLSATSFQISSNQGFKKGGGGSTAGSFSYSKGRYVGVIYGGGLCGWYGVSWRYNPYNTSGSDWALTLSVR